MPIPQLDDVNSLVVHKFSDREDVEARLLNPNQKLFIKNEIINITQQLLTLTFDPSNTLKFVQDDAYLKAQIAAYRYLLACSEEAEVRLRQPNLQFN